MSRNLGQALILVLSSGTAVPVYTQTGDTKPRQIYECPGRQFTNVLTPAEAEKNGCKPMRLSEPTTVPGTKVFPAGSPASAMVVRPPESKVDPGAQRQRDSDARRILEAELRREEDKLAALKRELNNGEPERRGDERNYQNYLDRVAQMRASLSRGEADIAALKRELAKLQP